MKSNCTHNVMVTTGIKSHTWKCADCGHIYGGPIPARKMIAKRV